jgi:hypothetical protein
MLDLAELLTEVREWNPRLSLLLSKIQTAVNQLGIVTGADPTGHSSTPARPASINVSAGTDHVHVALTDVASRSRPLSYFIEISANDPSFQAPYVRPLGPARDGIFSLPAMDGDSTQITYYVRGYSQYQGSSPSDKVVFGGASAPTPITLSGSSMLNLLSSPGAGTAETNGQRPGFGFGPQTFSQTERAV